MPDRRRRITRGKLKEQNLKEDEEKLATTMKPNEVIDLKNMKKRERIFLYPL